MTVALLTLGLAVPQLAGLPSTARAFASSTSGATDVEPSSYHPITPYRFLDTRSGTGATGAVAPHGTLTVSLPTQTIPELSRATSVVANVVVTQPNAGGHLTVYPGGTARPATSNINFTRGITIANLVTVVPGDRGLSFYNGSDGTVQLVADLSGYYTADMTGGSYYPVNPSRLMDTRNGTGVRKGSVPAFGLVTLKLPSAWPQAASAVALNVTVSQPTHYGYLRVYAADASGAAFSTLNFPSGKTVPNLAVVRLDSSQSVSFFNNSPGTVQISADAFGYYVDDTLGAFFYPTPPTRVLDTRNGTGTGSAGAVRSVDYSLPVPQTGPGATAVVLNVTVTQEPAAGHLAVRPAASGDTGTSNVNFAQGSSVANLVAVQATYSPPDSPPRGIPPNLTFVSSSAEPVQLVADLAGWFRPGFISAQRAPTGDATDSPAWLVAVDCWAMERCGAVGAYADQTIRSGGLMELLTSSGWIAEDAPLPGDAADTPYSDFQHIQCLSAGWCAAIRTYYTDTNQKKAAVDFFGTHSAHWVLPIPANGQYVDLGTLSCSSLSSCVAAGAYRDVDGHEHGLLETLSGSTWTALPAPLPADAATASESELAALSCPAAGACVAVGGITDASHPSAHGLIETLHSGTWTAQEATAPSGMTNRAGSLEAVHCVTASYCVAPGHDYLDDGGDDVAAANQITSVLSGGVWNTSLGPASGTGQDTSIDCAAVGSCATVYEEDSLSIQNEYGWSGVRELHGANWRDTSVELPFDVRDDDPRGGRLSVGVSGDSAVSCPTTIFCMAAGGYTSLYGFEGFIATMAGHPWPVTQAVVPRDIQTTQFWAGLNSVSCPSPTWCAAVGMYVAADGHDHGLINTIQPAATTTATPGRGR